MRLPALDSLRQGPKPGMLSRDPLGRMNFGKNTHFLLEWQPHHENAKRLLAYGTVMATNTFIPLPPDTGSKTSPKDLREAILDLMSIEDQEVASHRLVEKLLSLSSGNVEIVEIDQTPLRLLQADGKRPQFMVHPQGMEIDRHTGLIYVTAVEIIEERDRARHYCGKGRAHLFECDAEGRTLRSINLTSNHKDEYHPSGMVLTGDAMYIALAQYLPNTSSTIIKFNVKDWTYEKLFHIGDHVGLVVPNLDEGELFLGTWGSRHYYCTDLKGNIKSKHQNPCSDEMEHQDAQLIHGGMSALNPTKANHNDPEILRSEGVVKLATGVTAHGMKHFGLDLIDMKSWRILTSLRWPSAPYLTMGGWAPFANPTFLWVDSYDRILALAAPDGDHEQAGKIATLRLYTLSRRE
jgi:hypothetical protein